MKLILIGQDFRYELEKLLRIFMPFEKIEFFDGEIKDFGDSYAKVSFLEDKNELSVELKLETFFKTKSETVIDKIDEKTKELKLAVLLYDLLTEAFGYRPPWGILTGVRPAKLYSRLARQQGVKDTEDYFRNQLFVSDSKVSLCRETFEKEEAIIRLSKPNSFSLYLSIPFCPTRCSYCSFVSHSIANAKKLIPQYVALLCREITETARLAKELCLQLETVYIGGGTPTSLTAQDLDVVMSTVNASFDRKHLREYTVEAGRPDTITPEKLKVILKNGATRISVNPQTMSDRVLETIGRKHTTEQTISAFRLAREIGFDNINMDLIAGLPGDDPFEFENTVKKVLELDPESVTVHALSMKRASNLSADGSQLDLTDGRNASLSVELAHRLLGERGIVPYYMYRQSKTVGNLENVGYAKTGKECLYNVYIMDETHTILACGASAVTKLRQPGGNQIERIFNFKYPYEYISRFDEMCSRKEAVKTFYEKYPCK